MRARSLRAGGGGARINAWISREGVAHPLLLAPPVLRSGSVLVSRDALVRHGVSFLSAASDPNVPSVASPERGARRRAARAIFRPSEARAHARPPALAGTPLDYFLADWWYVHRLVNELKLESCVIREVLFMHN